MQLPELLPHLFRTEYSKIVAVLCRSFGLAHIEIAEDIASETFLKASETWGINGLPANPTAWLYTVAKNKTKDYFKHHSHFLKLLKEAGKTEEIESGQEFEFDSQKISDSQLSMIFAVCDPANPVEGQIALALQILCGFSVEEIATAFLTNTETIKKRLYRARATLRNGDFQITSLGEDEFKARLDTVLKTLYLLFNEGYFSKTNNQLIRKDLCSEALRLTGILTENPLTNTPKTYALLALLCFQSSRLNSRIDDKGEVLLYEQQDKNLWDRALIEKGNDYLATACNGNEISKYHLEAGIAYWHTTPTDEGKWPSVLQLYNELVLIEYSPMIALNRTFAFSKVYGHENGIREAEKLGLDEQPYYHSLLGYLYTPINIDKAIHHYEIAVELTESKIEKQTLSKEIRRLIESLGGSGNSSHD